jgi:two-component system, NarL family, nitrate/nitrite response regulator NarL
VKPTTLYVCESQPIVIAGLRAVLAEAPDVQLVGHSFDPAEAQVAVGRLTPDVVLLGHSHVGRALLTDLQRIATTGAPGIVLWVTEFPDLDCLRALQMGAKGVIRKTASVERLLECLRSVSEGQIWLEDTNAERLRKQQRRTLPRMTPRERQIVELVCRGLKNKEIAAELSITPGTVKVHLMHIFEKAGVKDRFQLALQGRQLLGFEAPPEVPEQPVETIDDAVATNW